MARYWGLNIRIDGTWIQTDADGNTTRNPQSASYEVNTQDQLRLIAGSRVGGVLIRLINGAPGTVEIRPLQDALLRETSEAPVFGDRAVAPVATTEYARNVAKGSNLCVPYRCEGDGSDCTVWFQPTTWVSGSKAKSSADPDNHTRPDDVLFHELVHALRALRGVFDNKGRMGFGFDSFEEFVAVMLTNIYLADNGRLNDMRWGHSIPFLPMTEGRGPFGKVQSDGGFYTCFDTEIDALAVRMPDLCDQIATVGQGWNPLRVRKDQERHKGNDPRWGPAVSPSWSAPR